MDELFTSIETLFDAATDPQGAGLPMVIGGGLAMILYLMNTTTKEWKKTEDKIAETKESQRKTGYPFKPF